MKLFDTAQFRVAQPVESACCYRTGPVFLLGSLDAHPSSLAQGRPDFYLAPREGANEGDSEKDTIG